MAGRGGRTPGLKIELFKHPIAVDPDHAEKSWKVLEEAIHQIHNQNGSGLSYETLYRNAYNMVLHKAGPRLYQGVTDTLTSYLQSMAQQIKEVQGLPFLAEVKQRWEDYNKSTQMIRDILMYMDRTFVVQQSRTPVFALGLELWTQHVLHHPVIRERLRALLLEQINKERAGELIDRGVIRSTTKMLTDLGDSVYAEDFERPFLEQARHFYRMEAQSFLATSDCPEYLRKAERRLAEEAERVKLYLDPATEPRITKVLEVELIAAQRELLLNMPNSGLVALLRDDKYADLGRMYSLFRRVDHALEEMRGLMKTHIEATGKALVSDPELVKDPVGYVERLLEERAKYEKIWSQSFNSDKKIREAINKAFEEFLNHNPRSAEYISLFIDDKLRKGVKGMGDDAVEAVLDKVMVLFRYLKEKDMFETYYKQHLSKRLLYGRTASDDAERAMLLKLKTECGYQYTAKLEGMFMDVKTSADWMRDFREEVVAAAGAEQLPLDLSVLVCTTGNWPQAAAAPTTGAGSSTQAATAAASSSSQAQLPEELGRCCTVFGDWYKGRHNGRNLSWHLQHGTADVRVQFASRVHELNVSTYQLVVLMLFQATDALTYREIAEQTGIPPQDLKRALQSMSLVKAKQVLTKEPKTKEIKDEDVFTFNAGFTSKQYKVKIGTVTAQREGEQEKAETRHKVEEDRGPLIDAAIVRLMKSRKRLSHNEVVAEVTRQLQGRFLPNPQIIKKRIEGLIDREFLERDEVDRKVYKYLA